MPLKRQDAPALIPARQDWAYTTDVLYQPKIGDAVIVVGSCGIFRVTVVEHDIHTVDVENTATHTLLSFVPWKALKYAGLG
jgi:hypothetical protein